MAHVVLTTAVRLANNVIPAGSTYDSVTQAAEIAELVAAGGAFVSSTPAIKAAALKALELFHVHGVRPAAIGTLVPSVLVGSCPSIAILDSDPDPPIDDTQWIVYIPPDKMSLRMYSQGKVWEVDFFIEGHPDNPATRSVIVEMNPNTPFPGGNAVSVPVTFDPPFPDNQYAVEATVVGGDGNYKLHVIQKMANQCLIRLINDGSNFYPSGIDVIARAAIVEEFGGYSSAPHPTVPSAMFLAPRYLWVVGGALTYTGMFKLTGTDESHSPPTYIYTQIDTPENQLTVIKNEDGNWGWMLSSPHAAPDYKVGEAGPYGAYSAGSVVQPVMYVLADFPDHNGVYRAAGELAGGSVYYYCPETGLYLNDWLPAPSTPWFTLNNSMPPPIPWPAIYSALSDDPAGAWMDGTFSPITGTATPTEPLAP